MKKTLVRANRGTKWCGKRRVRRHFKHGAGGRGATAAACTHLTPALALPRTVLFFATAMAAIWREMNNGGRHQRDVENGGSVMALSLAAAYRVFGRKYQTDGDKQMVIW